MTLIVVGAAPHNQAVLRSLATARGISLVHDWTARRPDWVIVPSVALRESAIARYSLPPWRVIELSGLDSAEGLNEATMARALARFGELREFHPTVSPMGVAIVRAFLPAITWALERWLGSYVVDPDWVIASKAERTAEKAAAKAVRVRERQQAARLEREDELKRRAERKAERKAARRAAERSIADDPAGVRRSR